MARRSDFAQKLLDDLRLRKERMAASQSSKGSNPLPVDAYAYSKQAYKGSRKMETQNIGFRNGSTRNMSSEGNRSLTIQENSKQIVLLGRDHSRGQVGDLSMALAFALENGGKLKRMNSSSSGPVLSFLQQMGNRSVDLGKIDRVGVNRHHSSSSRFPNLSHFQIKEISKGAQKLNQILRAWSNGLSFDRYSVEIGKELLKGAIDLEESLRMLVNLQEASENMISPQRKARITLLDDDEDDQENTITKDENKQLARPRFSFDKPFGKSHNLQGLGRQSVTAQTYPSEAKNSKNDANALGTSHLSSHRRSTSYDLDFRTPAAIPEQKSLSASSKSKQAKGKIPNVIAKLMGLEDLPQGSKDMMQKESGSKLKNEGIVLKKTADGSSAAERNTKDAENIVPPAKKQKQIQLVQVPIVQGKYTLQGQKNLATDYASYEAPLDDGKTPGKDAQGIKPSKSSYKVSKKTDHKSYLTQLDQSTSNQKDAQEKETQQDDAKLRELHGRRRETKEHTLRHELQQIGTQTQKESKASISWQSEREHKVKDTNKLIANNRPKSSSGPRYQQPFMLRSFEQKHVKHQAGPSQQQSARKKIQSTREKGSEAMPRKLPNSMHDAIYDKKHPHRNQANLTDTSSSEFIGAVESNRLSSKKHHADLAQDRYSTSSNSHAHDFIKRNANENFFPGELRAELDKGTSSIPPVVGEEHLSLPVVGEEHFSLTATKRVKATKVHKGEMPRKIDEPMARSSGTSPLVVRPLNPQISILQEMKQRTRVKLAGPKEAEQERTSRSTEVEPCNSKPDQALAISHIPEELQVKAKEASNLCGPHMVNELGSHDRPQVDNIISTGTNVHQSLEHHLGGDELSSQNTVLDPFNEAREGNVDIIYPTQPEDQKPQPKPERPQPLTKIENRLKKILISSQTFLNTAEVLFKLNIPFEILHVGSHDSLDEESKILLDCGYEIMKRKGRKQELSTHPFTRTASISCIKVTALDDLIKQLQKDINKLKCYGRRDNRECQIEEHLPKMLECDVYNRYPDVNCMWDYGWDDIALASLDEVTREVEKFVLNGLLDEVTRDMIMLF